jgi:methylated-DNA-[protein]-cysteine S-methyltransferase
MDRGTQWQRLSRLLDTHSISTPIGPFRLVVRDGRLLAAAFDDGGRLEAWLKRRFEGQRPHGRRSLPPRPLVEAIDAYFAGTVEAIDTVETDPVGTPFQQSVWTALRSIPAGRPMTYAALAAAIGRPTAVRAVGHANAANPISIVVPCHRLVGSNGSLTGYGGGLDRKRWLLAHEARHARRTERPCWNPVLVTRNS